MKKLLFLLLLAAMLPAQAADYFLPYTEADGSANVRTAPNTHSKILTVLDYRSAQREILGRQGGWFHIRLNNGRTGYVHQNQGYIVQNYIVASPDGAANVRSIDPGYPIGRAPVKAISTKASCAVPIRQPETQKAACTPPKETP